MRRIVTSDDATMLFRRVDSLSSWLRSNGVDTELDCTEFVYVGKGPDGGSFTVDPGNPPRWLDSLICDVIVAHHKSSQRYLFLNAICDYLYDRFAVQYDDYWEILDCTSGKADYVYGTFDGYHQVVPVDEAVDKFNYTVKSKSLYDVPESHWIKS